MKYEVAVSLKNDVLDPEARTICQSLKRLGYKNIQDIKIKKVYVIDTENTSNSESLIEEIADQHLTNPVAEKFEVKKI